VRVCVRAVTKPNKRKSQLTSSQKKKKVDALRQHVTERIQVLVVINSPWGPLREAFLTLCEALDVRAVIPPEVPTTLNKTRLTKTHSKKNAPSTKHQDSA